MPNYRFTLIVFGDLPTFNFLGYEHRGYILEGFFFFILLKLVVYIIHFTLDNSNKIWILFNMSSVLLGINDYNIYNMIFFCVKKVVHIPLKSLKTTSHGRYIFNMLCQRSHHLSLHNLPKHETLIYLTS